MPISGKEEVLPSIESLFDYFEVSILSNPSSNAVFDVSNFEYLTFLQLSTRVNQLTRHLLRIFNKLEFTSKCPDEDRIVVVCISPSIDLIVALMAILKAGGVYIPLDVDFPQSRVNHIIQDAKPQVLISKGNPSAVSHLKENPVQGFHLIELDDCQSEIELESEEGISNEELGVQSTPKKLAAILYTSGSTGIPKGVKIPHSAVLNRLIWQWRTFPYEPNEICCFKTALTFVDSISEIFGPLLTGHQVLVIPKSMTKNVEKMIEVLDKFKVRRLVLVPSLLRSILLECSRRNTPTLENLKLWICSGEVFPLDLLHTFFKTFKNGQAICNFYGSTEVMGDVTYIQLSSSEDVSNSIWNKKVPIGAPVSNCSIYLVNKNLEEVLDGNVGEILVSGLNLASGYVGTTQQDKFLLNPHCSQKGYDVLYRTGDYGRYVNGWIFYEGRTDSQLKVRGHRVDLMEVQTAVQNINGIQKCCILCYKPGEVDQALVAFYTTNDVAVTNDYMKQRITALLPQYMHPQLINVDELPLLVNGKVDRQQLLQQYEKHGFEKSSSETEIDLTDYQKDDLEMAETLLRTVARVLGPSAPTKLSLDQNFFEIGGNSLNAILTITSFQDAGYQIGISEFLNAKNLLDVLSHAVKCEETFCEIQKKITTLCGEGNELNEYKCFPLKPECKEKVIRILSKSFANKGDLEMLLDVDEREYNDLFEIMWPHYLQQGLSFVICRMDSVEEIVAVSINYDWYTEPDIKFPSINLQYVFDFIEDCESKARLFLPKGDGRVLRSSVTATRDDISPRENVTLLRLMEEETFRVAKRKGFEALFTTNTSSLSQHICEDLLGYEILCTSAFNKWVSEDGQRPFQAANDTQMAVCSAYFIPTEEICKRKWSLSIETVPKIGKPC